MVRIAVSAERTSDHTTRRESSLSKQRTGLKLSRKRQLIDNNIYSKEKLRKLKQIDSLIHKSDSDFYPMRRQPCDWRKSAFSKKILALTLGKQSIAP